MYNIIREFVSHETRAFKFKIGHHLASSLSGFIAGVIFTSIVWATGILVWRMLSLF